MRLVYARDNQGVDISPQSSSIFTLGRMSDYGHGHSPDFSPLAQWRRFLPCVPALCCATHGRKSCLFRRRVVLATVLTTEWCCSPTSLTGLLCTVEPSRTLCGSTMFWWRMPHRGCRETKLQRSKKIKSGHLQVISKKSISLWVLQFSISSSQSQCHEL